MFDIRFEDKDGNKQLVWQTSWGLTTRTIGVALMVHGDDNGCNWSPYIAPTQIVIVPCGITKKTDEAKKDAINRVCESLHDLLKKARLNETHFPEGLVDEGLLAVKCRKLRVVLDSRENVTAGFKFNHWELMVSVVHVGNAVARRSWPA
jgi:hypothetical protein